MRRGRRLLSQISQVITLDYRDSKIVPHSGYIVELGTDYAGLGGDARFIRGNVNGAYYIPLERQLGNPDWGIKIGGSTGYMDLLPGGREEIIDRFFLGGDNLRGFETGGAGPHDLVTDTPLGGRFIWTQTTELRYPLPVSPDLGLSGRAFVDVGSLTAGIVSRALSACQVSAIQSVPDLGIPRPRASAPVSASPGVPRSV